MASLLVLVFKQEVLSTIIAKSSMAAIHQHCISLVTHAHKAFFNLNSTAGFINSCIKQSLLCFLLGRHLSILLTILWSFSFLLTRFKLSFKRIVSHELLSKLFQLIFSLYRKMNCRLSFLMMRIFFYLISFIYFFIYILIEEILF